MTATVHFSIKYDGPALANHQMDVRELAPALIALSSLLEEANRSLFPDSAEVRVHVHGTFKSGSFEFDLVALQSIKDQIVSIFSGPEASAAANLLEILGAIGILGSAGVIGVVKWLKGRKPSSIRFDGDKTIFEIHTTEFSETFEADLATGKLYQSRVIRQSLARVVKPLENEGIDFFASSQDGVTEAVFSRPCKIQIHDQSTIRRQTLCAIRRTNTHPTTHRRLYSHQNFAQRKPAKGFDPLCHNRSQ